MAKKKMDEDEIYEIKSSIRRQFKFMNQVLKNAGDAADRGRYLESRKWLNQIADGLNEAGGAVGQLIEAVE